ncbi:MAG: MBL fold metallo-hydrolase [Betaproteobacteria bacterium]|nr:MBL fold metallo-hydrolase [Betaproteobacteria bacterium]
MENIVPGVHVPLNDLVSRITAPNPGMMTGAGTNTYIVGGEELAVIDPGPESDSHLAALLEAVGKRLKWIFCTHTHLDHSPGARALKEATGAKVLGYAPVPDDGRQDTAFTPDLTLREGDAIGMREFRLRAVHTPGHASNHLCYLFEDKGILFTGDHIMQGSKNPATLDDLLPLAYDDVPQRVHAVARRSLHAHLIKLQREKRAAETDGMWTVYS